MNLAGWYAKRHIKINTFFKSVILVNDYDNFKIIILKTCKIIK